MKRRGITQRELSKIIRVNQPTISRWFNGQEPYSKALHKLSDFFRVSIYLLESDDLTEKEFESKIFNSITLISFAEKLRIIISRKNLTQSEFAEIVGVSHRALTEWLSGVKPHPRNIVKIAKSFGVSIKSLLDDSLPVEFSDNTVCARKLKHLIATHGMTQMEVAKQFGVSHPAVNNWLNGALPRPSKMKQIADFFNVSVSFLTGEQDNDDRRFSCFFPAEFRTAITPEVITALNKFGILHRNQNAVEASKHLALLRMELSTQEIKYEKD